MVNDSAAATSGNYGTAAPAGHSHGVQTENQPAHVVLFYIIRVK